jgi:hypothetical protein
MANWFHPYLRAGNRCFSVCFVTNNEEQTHAVLQSNNVQEQRRLDNWCELVGLRKRWQDALKRKVRGAQNKLRGYYRRTRGQPTLEDVCEKLNEWAQSAADEIGVDSFKILEHYYYQAAAAEDPVLFDELWIYVSDADPV